MIDTRTIANIPSLSSATTALIANPARSMFGIQNQGTNPLLVCFGTPVGLLNATYHLALKGGQTLSDGSGAIFTLSGSSCYSGAIFAGGTGALYTVLEY